MNRLLYAHRARIPTPEPEPGRLVRAWRFAAVAWVAAMIYAGYKSIQLWSRLVGFRTRDGSPATLITLANLLLGNTVRRGAAALTPTSS